jgi:hypothetical protein
MRDPFLILYFFKNDSILFQENRLVVVAIFVLFPERMRDPDTYLLSNSYIT